jgi:hypothetical protein
VAKRACIYVLLWRHAHRVYVGGTSHFSERIKWHRRRCRAARASDSRPSDRHRNPELVKLCTLYGMPEVDVLEEIEPGPLLSMRLAAAETRWIAWALNRYGPAVVVNLSDPKSADYAGA